MNIIRSEGVKGSVTASKGSCYAPILYIGDSRLRETKELQVKTLLGLLLLMGMVECGDGPDVTELNLESLVISAT